MLLIPHVINTCRIELNSIVLSVYYTELFQTLLASYTCCKSRAPASSHTQRHHRHHQIPFTVSFTLLHVTQMIPSCYLRLSYSVDWLQNLHPLDWPSARCYWTPLSRRVSKCPSLNPDRLLVWLSVVREWNCWKADVLPDTAVFPKSIWSNESQLLAVWDKSLEVLTQKTSDQD